MIAIYKVYYGSSSWGFWGRAETRMIAMAKRIDVASLDQREQKSFPDRRSSINRGIW